MKPSPNSTDLDLTAAELAALRATRSVIVLANLVSEPFYVNTQIPFGITLPEWRALREICECPGVTQTEIAEQSAQHIMTLSRAVRQLTHKGLIEGRIDPDDRRRTRLFATSIGREMADEMKHREAVQARHMLDGISEQEARQLVRIVGKLIEHVRATERPAPPPAARDWRAVVESRRVGTNQAIGP